MGRRAAAILVSLVLAGAVAAPVEAKKAKAGAVGFHLNWAGDCAGAAYMSLKAEPNPEGCALYFPGLANTHTFPAIDGVPFRLDARKAIALDLNFTNVASVSSEWEVVVSGTIDGKSVDIATGTQTVTGEAGSFSLSFELKPDQSLHGKNVERLNLTVSWTDGATYSSLDTDSATSTMVVHATK